MCINILYTSYIQNLLVAMTYLLRFPFELSPGREINGLEEMHEYSIDNLTWTFESKKDHYVLKITGLCSDSACQDYLYSIWSAFNWLLIKRDIAIKATLELGKVTYAQDPEIAARNLEKSFKLTCKTPVDGLVDADKPSAYPSDKNIYSIGVGKPSVILGASLKNIMSLLEEGISIRRGKPSINDTRLQTALELYSAYWYENTDNARLLTLVLALESLLDDTPRNEIVTQLLDKWKIEIDELLNRHATDSKEYEALKSLEGELLSKKTASISERISSLVHNSLQFLSHNEAIEFAQKAKWIYKQRSKLAHQGYLSKDVLLKATSEAREIVKLVLEARYLGFSMAN